MKRILSALIAIFLVSSLFASIPNGYYSDASGKTGYELKTALYHIIKGHRASSYKQLWKHMEKTDKKPNGKVWDVYSDVPGGNPPYEFNFGTNKCGNYSGEGSCYNREHSFPKSWFDDAKPMYSDLFHLYPTDGKVNGMRSNYPFGEVSESKWISLNGCKLGSCSVSGYSGTVFEPIDEYKGDFARTYFYMATRYQNIISRWEHNSKHSDAVLDGTSDQVYEEWYLNMILDWHNQDPVSQKEIDRNNAIYKVQNNRNPFIDHPEYVAMIWGGEPIPNPVISNISHNPTTPRSTDNVTIQATITDDNSIESAELIWGTNQTAINNTITMTRSGVKYSAVIDKQADETVVYFKIIATDNESNITQSPVKSYQVSNQRIISNPIFEENFGTITPKKPIAINNWITYIEAGTKTWFGKEYKGQKYASMSAYKSTGMEESNIAWLITPSIDLSNISKATLTFKSKDGYNNGNPVELFISSNYTNKVSTADWTKLEATFATEAPSDGYATSFTKSGDIDLSAHCGNRIRLAYKYTGGANVGIGTTMQIDDIVVTGESSSTTNIDPVITDITIDPSQPTTKSNVNISAQITDDKEVRSAKLIWGTRSGELQNTVIMSKSTNTYSGIIPAQSKATTVYFRIKATDNESTESISSEINYNISKANGIDLALSKNINVYPNPTKGNIKITLSNNLQLKSVEVYNLTGEKVQAKTNINSDECMLNLETLHKGIYFVKINTPESSFTKKIIFE